MSMQWPAAGVNDVGTYLISGVPFITNGTVGATATKVSFSTVTKNVSVKNTATGGATVLIVAFTENGLNDNPTGTNRRFFLREGEVRDMNIRIKELWLSGSVGAPTFDVVAGLTHVMPSQLPTITGSVPSGSTNAPPLFQGVG